MCVTGGAGFIGGHLVDALFGLGASVTVIDDLSNSTAKHVAELVDLDPERVRFVHGSILDDAALEEAMRGARLVFHLAAMGSVPRSVAEPERAFAVNTIGTVRVAQAAVKAGASRIVYSASSSAYGDPPGPDTPRAKIETQVPSPLSPYAASKLGGEHVMRAWATSYAISTISLRYFNIFGPRQPADTAYAAAIPAFMRALSAGQPPVVFGDGYQTRDFTYVANAVIANLLAGHSLRPLAGEVVNIGSGRAVGLIELVRMIASACGVPHIGPRHEPSRAGDVRHSLADLSAAKELIDYVPIVSLQEGLESTLAWYRGAVVEAGNQ